MNRTALWMRGLLTGMMLAGPCLGVLWGADAAPEQPAEAMPEAESALPRISMEFENVPLRDVLKAFSLQTGLNVIASGEIGEQPVTLYFEQVTVLDALDQILRASNLTYERAPESDIYIVRSTTEESSTITRVYRLKYARVSTSVLARTASAFAVFTPFEAASASALATGTAAPGGGGSSGGSGSGSNVGIDRIVQQLLTDRGSVIVDERTNTLVVTDMPDNFPRIEAVLAALDVRTDQVLVDAEILETSLQNLKDVGIEWGSDAEGTMGSMTPGVRNTRFPFNFLAPNRAARPSVINPLDLEGEPIPLTPFTATTLNFNDALAVLQALKTETETKVLARPKVLTLDNESAIIRLSTNQAIGFETTVDATTGTTTAEPERETTGIILVVTPQVNDNGYITMMVEPSVTQVVPSQVISPDGATAVDPKTRSVRTIVRVKNGDTLVLGGLIDRNDSTSVKSVPLLGDIPLLGEMFRNTEVNDITTELIAFLTPRILQDPATEQLPNATASAEAGMELPEREQEPMAPQDAIDAALDGLEQHRL